MKLFSLQTQQLPDEIPLCVAFWKSNNQYVLSHLHKDLMLRYVVVIEGAQSGSNFDVWCKSCTRLVTGTTVFAWSLLYANMVTSSYWTYLDFLKQGLGDIAGTSPYSSHSISSGLMTSLSLHNREGNSVLTETYNITTLEKFTGK